LSFLKGEWKLKWYQRLPAVPDRFGEYGTA
jgi:hypothetical protein